MGSLLLLVNERNSTTANAFQKASKPGFVDRIVLSAVYADAARIMVEHALTQDDFTEDTDSPEGIAGRHPPEPRGTALPRTVDHRHPTAPAAVSCLVRLRPAGGSEDLRGVDMGFLYVRLLAEQARLCSASTASWPSPN
ncbi:hypothetical protein STENM223S_07586 [Streptomyces tendae]